MRSPRAEPFGRVLHVLQAPLRRPEDEKRDERHSHDEHAGRDDRHRRTKLARDTRDRRPGQHRDAADGIARHKDGYGLPRPLGRELHRAGGVGREPPIRSTAIAPATTAAATTTAASAARGEVTPSRFERDRVLQLGGDLVAVRRNPTVTHDDDERLEDVGVLLAHVALQIERGIRIDRVRDV